MSGLTRRSFVQQGAGLAAGAMLSRANAQIIGSNERIRIGIIGCGGQAADLMKSFAAFADVAVTQVCDVDAGRLEAAVSAVEKVARRAPTPVKDLRRVLDSREVDAVVIGTPDHWHAPATILACQAGKHVYVEKPCSHNLREGRLMIEAARRHRRVVQVGTQSRNLPHVLEAIRVLRSGAIGKVLQAKAWTNQLRASIGHKSPADPPPQLDYDLWVGAAPYVAYRPNCAHYTWRWWHNFGTGDIGNDGVHELDIARWGLDVQGHPTTVTGSGGKLFFDDDQQFPDTYSVTYDYPGEGTTGRRQLVFELRNWCPYPLNGYENGNAFYGTKGMMLLSKNIGWKIIGGQGAPGPEGIGKGFDSSPHHRDFLECIRTGAHPAADIEVGHLSTALAHLGNIAVRTGRTLRFDPSKETILDDAQAAGLLGREYRAGHWAIPKGV